MISPWHLRFEHRRRENNFSKDLKKGIRSLSVCLFLLLISRDFLYKFPSPKKGYTYSKFNLRRKTDKPVKTVNPTSVIQKQYCPVPNEWVQTLRYYYTVLSPFPDVTLRIILNTYGESTHNRGSIGTLHA